MIDLHCHILPGVDDGADSEEESCMMAQIAADDGVEAIVMTPHCNVPGQFDNFASSYLFDRFHELQKLVRERDIPLELYSGMEVYVTRNLTDLLEQNRLLTLGESHYLLMEFGFDEPASFMDHMLQAVKRQGFIPVIAHPERYYCVQDDHEQISWWNEDGYVLQINKGSLFGMFGQQAAETAHWCLSEGCIHLIGSDAHSPFRRTTRMGEAWEYISEFNSPEIADFLFRDNPRRILNDEPVRPVLDEF